MSGTVSYKKGGSLSEALKARKSGGMKSSKVVMPVGPMNRSDRPGSGKLGVTCPGCGYKL